MAAHTDNAVDIDAPRDYVWERMMDIESWPSLFSEYAKAEVIEEEGNTVKFRLTTHPDPEYENQVWSWVSEREADPESYSSKSRRIETGPFEYMTIEWEFEERARVIKIEVLKKPAAGGDDAPAKETRSGSISGEIKSKKEQNKNIVIEVLAPGEEKARSYFVQYDPKLKAPIPDVLKAVAAANVGDKVVFDWEATGHGPAIVKFKVAGKDKK